MQVKELRFLKLTPLRGPNIWTYRPVVEVWVDIGELEDFPSNKIPGLYERLTAWLPGLVEHRCGVGERGGFLLRLREGTWAGHILEHVTIELQNLAGMHTGFGKARETSQRGLYKVVVRSRHEKVTMAAFHAARDLLLAAINNQAFDLENCLSTLRDMVDSLCLGPSTACIVDAATERGIPHLRLTEGNLVQLGYGASQRRIWTAETDQTGAIAESICSDKDLTKRLLAACGLPVPEGEVVDSPQAAWEAAESIGVPVVVKPTDANHGRGVSLNLISREEIEAAYHVAADEGSEVLVERFVPGNEYRLLVVGGKLAAAACGEIATVTADGRSSLAELIEAQLNSDPRRGLTEDFPLNRIILEHDPAIRLELARQGFTADSIPAQDQVVLIQRNGNVAADITDQVHPEVAEVACLAARVVGLDIAGIDLVAQDIARPLQEQHGAIVEINAGPGLLMHLKPASGTPRPVGRHIVESLFPGAGDGRIPVIGVTGGEEAALTAHLLLDFMQLAGKKTGLAGSNGLFFNRRQVEPGNRTDWDSGRKLLMNRGTQAAIFQHHPRNILAEGLAYDRCRIGIVTSSHLDTALDAFFVHEPQQLLTVLRTQIDVVLAEGAAILNADDALTPQLMALSDGEVILFGGQPQQPLLAEHLAQGKRAVILRAGHIMLHHGPHDSPLHPLPPRIPATPLLAAVAAAWACDLPPELMRAGLNAFAPPSPTEGN